MSVQHANIGIVKKDLQLYYNREFAKSFRGESSTNLITNTVTSSGSWDGNLFNNWINATVTENVDIAPDGTMTAVMLTGGYSRWTNSITVAASTTYTASIWLKNIDLSTDPIIRIATGLNGTLVDYATNVLSVSRSTITGWKRVSVSATIPASGVNQIQFGVTFSNSYPHSTSILVWGAQFEKKAYTTQYSNLATDYFSRNETITNLLTSTYSSLPTNWNVDGSGQATIGTYSYIENNTAIRVVDVNSNTRLNVDQLAVVSASTTYTFSVKYRKVSGTPTLRFQIAWYNSSNAFVGSASFPTTPQINIYDINGWQLAWYTVTSPASTAKVLWFIQDGNDYTTYNHTYDLKEPQIQTGTYPTKWTSNTATANTLTSGGGLLDISGNNVNADLTNVLFNSSGYYFDGSSTSIDTGYSILNIDPSQSFSIEAIVNFDALTSYSPSTFTISNVNTTTNVITTSVVHGLVAGDRISFYVSGGSLPSPLLDGSNIAPYYIISPTLGTFKVSTSSGGAEVDITTAGSGTITALVPSKAGMLFGRANYGGIGIYYHISATNVVSIFGYSRTTAGYYNTPIATISTGITYSITVVFDALNQSQYFLYINGVSQGSLSCPSSAIYNNSTVGNFSIGEGGQADGGGTLIYNPFKGSCPMQRIYRRALTAAEVLQNFNATRKTYGL